MRSFFAFAAGLVFVAACSSSDDVSPPPTGPSPDGGGGPTGDGGTSAGANMLCAPLHRTLDPSAERYVIYASDQEAVAALTTFLPKAGRKAPLPPGHPLQAKAEAILNDVYPAFQKVYPTETAGLDVPPRAAIIDDATPNAFALSAISTDPAMTKAPWVVMFHTGAFNDQVNEDDLRGLVAHELAHLLLLNGTKPVLSIYGRHYLAGTNEADIHGAYQSDDVKVAARVDDLVLLQKVIGRVGLPELLGQPVVVLKSVGGSDPEYPAIFKLAYAKYKSKSANPAACTKFESDNGKIAAIFTGKVEPADFALTLSDADRAAIKTASETANTSMKQCVGGLKRSISAMVQELTGKASSTLDDDEKAMEAKYNGTDFFAELAELSQLKHQKLRDHELATDLPFEQLRYYREEEDADVASTRVMRQMAREPRSTALFLLHSGDKDYSDDCLAKVQAGTVPPYGFMRSDHPATCWRYWNQDRIAKKLDSCPK